MGRFKKAVVVVVLCYLVVGILMGCGFERTER